MYCVTFYKLCVQSNQFARGEFYTHPEMKELCTGLSLNYLHISGKGFDFSMFTIIFPV